MSGRARLTGLPSWIPPSFAWATIPDVFALRVPASDPDVVEFVATGSLEVELYRSRKRAMDSAAMPHWVGLTSGGEFGTSFVGQMDEAAWTVLRHTEDWKKRSKTASVHCHGIFGLPDGQELLVLVGIKEPGEFDAWLPDVVRDAARKLCDESLAVAGDSATGQALQRPVLNAERLLPDLPRAAIFKTSASLRVVAVERAATAAIINSCWVGPRDGVYVGLLSIPLGGKRIGLVTWRPHMGLPSYPEVRWAIQKGLPKVLRKPRREDILPAEFESTLQSRDETSVEIHLDLDGPEVLVALDDLRLDETDFRDRVARVRAALKEHGFDAIAWYQPYHVWTESTWGIYFDARKLDDLALSLFDDLRKAGVNGSQSAPAVLAFGLTHAHELFHARVEAALSWMEINALQPRYLRYTERVYDVLRETPDWLEEALANWSAWQWYRSEPVRSSFSATGLAMDGLDRIVDASLDLSPPGYREWRMGYDPATWRRFGTQLATGKPHALVKADGLPLESVLRNPLPYDLDSSDIPVRFVGRGVIADRLQTHPAIFNVPTRRELELALKFFKHVHVSGGGKGSHDKWVGPDQRAFILPGRDPVSGRVFRSFLQYLAIDKMTYVREVRPQL